MTQKLSLRSDVSTFRALDNLAAVNKRIKAGEDIVRLEAGQPCFGVPEAVLAYAKERLSLDKLQGYTDALGMQLLRARISAYVHQRYDVEVDPGRIGVTAGSSPGLVMAFLAAFDAGDTIAVCTPTYAAYMNTLKALDIKVVEIPTGPETNYQPTAELLEKSGQKFDGLIICSPSNPTGTLIDEAELQKICQWCDDKGVRLISDEAYHGITYEKPAQTALKFSKNVIVLNTFSKYFAMTGWRMGWITVPEEMAVRIKRLSESLYVSPPTISQHAAYKIFDHLDELDGYVAHYKANRDILRDALPKAGLTKLSAANGAFYFYADISEYTNDAESFCRAMVDEAGVSCTAGVDFDPTRGNTTMRISYAGTAEDMHKAADRIGNWLSTSAKALRA
ncbi:MAG: aminotransferase class I/II-fold pyridoxal phosphate-dependent enzyme [Alphaproteobacteria bacterium]|nr:aminotransferase class I/II-fold pyridoxal phosphate-dependent enzyme [Alphaproteobacteria bacterium]MCD8526031.1 aminotransferase class I/II-fold pyridoxal phosphate-dependent enzyme [Alphaproteobacteria bacterium]